MSSETDLVVFKDTDMADTEVLKRSPFLHRRTPLMVTLIRADTPSVDMQKMLEAGMSMARFNTSRTTMEEKIVLLERLHQAEEFLKSKHGLPDWPCATCIELKTSIVKTGMLKERTESICASPVFKQTLLPDIPKERSIKIREKTDVILTCDVSQYDKCTERLIFLDDPYLASDTKIGMEISITEDEIVLACKEILSDKAIKCNVIKGGMLKSMAYVCARSRSRQNRPYLTGKDLVLVDFAIEHEFDMIIVNYARHPLTVRKVKKYIGNKCKRPIIVSGISTAEGLRNLDEIIVESDGILLSREFLAFELSSSFKYRMPLIQKMVIGKCLQAGKPFYLSGGICQHALEHGTFLDRELSEVSHAVIDGVSGFVLKQCRDTDNTVMVIKELNSICTAIEPFSNEKRNFFRITEELKMPVNAAEAAAMSCVLVANQTNARAIILPTVSGRTTKLVLRVRPVSLIITVSKSHKTTRLLRTYRCCVPLLYTGGSKSNTWYDAVQDRIKYAVDHAVTNGWLKHSDPYVTLEKGREESAFCDTVRVWLVSTWKKHIVECDD